MHAFYLFFKKKLEEEQDEIQALKGEVSAKRGQEKGSCVHVLSVDITLD